MDTANNRITLIVMVAVLVVTFAIVIAITPMGPRSAAGQSVLHATALVETVTSYSQ